MIAVCRKCGLYWNISIRAKLGRKGYTCPRCVRKDRTIKTVLFVVGFIASCMTIPMFSNMAYKQRGYLAYGGEYLLPFVYVVIMGVIKEMSDIKEKALSKER